jgi:hypothetical protein
VCAHWMPGLHYSFAAFFSFFFHSFVFPNIITLDFSPLGRSQTHSKAYIDPYISGALNEKGFPNIIVVVLPRSRPLLFLLLILPSRTWGARLREREARQMVKRRGITLFLHDTKSCLSFPSFLVLPDPFVLFLSPSVLAFCSLLVATRQVE